MYYTYYGANSWLLELGGCRILVDPWLVGSLVFGNMPWLFKGDRPHPIDPFPDNIDLILLSQGLEDHTHRPTLARLDRAIPVLASITAAKVVQELGYTNITALLPGDQYTVSSTLKIEALSGAPIGLQVENGYVLTDSHHPISVYYEPHGYPPSNLDLLAPVDVVISPVLNLQLPFSIPIIQGQNSALALAQKLQPRLFLSTAVGGDIIYSGFLDKLISTRGNAAEFQRHLIDHQIPTQVVAPTPHQRCSAVIGV